MEDKKELNKILLGDENKNSPSGIKKTILLVVIAIIIILILLVVFWKMTRPEPKAEPMTTDSSIQKMDQIQGQDDDFDDIPMDDMNPSQDSDDKFDKILQDIQNKQKVISQETQEKPEPTMSEPLSPSVPAKTTAPTKAQAPLKPTLDKPTEPKATQSKALTQPKPVAKKEVKETKKPIASKPVASSKPAVSKVQKTSPMKKADANNGSNATPGFYLQVGAFSKTPNQVFLNKIKKFSYRTQASFLDGQLVTKYLIGPYTSQKQAKEDIENITKEITKPVSVQIK